MTKRISIVAAMALLFASALPAIPPAISAVQGNGRMSQGTVFFAPMTDKTLHAGLSKIQTVNGSEIFTTWGEIEKEEGVYDWAELDGLIENYRTAGKKVSLRIASASFSINDTPAYVFNKYGVRRIAAGPFLNFEKGLGDYQMSGGEIVAAGTGGNESGEGSGNPENKALRMTGTGSGKIFLTTSDAHELYSGVGYSLQFDYQTAGGAVLFVRVSHMSAGEVVKTEETEFRTDRAEFGTGSVEIDMKGTSCLVEWGLRGGGEALLDNVNIIERKTGYHVGTLTFPYYLDPRFEAAYEKFIQAFAAKYGADPVLDSVKVGGYGRWEEMTLCDDTNPDALQDQWVSYGYTDRQYIDHVKWCIDKYTEYFSQKNVMMCGVGYGGNDYFKNQPLVDWIVERYALEKRVGIQYNGWQSVCTEWGNDATAIFYMMKRFQEAGINTSFEEGGQINNDGAVANLPPFSVIMGHPVSLFNTAILYGTSYQWTYSNDIMEPYVARNNQYKNQSAGGAVLITKLYSLLGEFPFYSNTNMSRYFVHNDINLGLIQTKGNNRVSVINEYVDFDGVQALTSREGSSIVQFSLDDRLKYEGMYGSYLVVNYLDQGTDGFKLTGMTASGLQDLASFQKTGTGTWKSASFYDQNWTNYQRNGGKDILNELTIDDSGDGKEYVRSVEVNYVPARGFTENVVSEILPSADPDKGTALRKDAIELKISNDGGASVSGAAIPVTATSEYNYVVVKAKVFGEVDGKEELITAKEYYMPGKIDWVYLPLAFSPDLKEYRVELLCDKGSAVWNTADDGTLSYKLYEFDKSGQSSAWSEPEEDQVRIEALQPFGFIRIPDKKFVGKKITVRRIMPGGGTVVVGDGLTVSGEGIAAITPQTAGRYEISSPQGRIGKAQAIYLTRKTSSNAATRYLLGEPDEVFSAIDKTALWKYGQGFDEVYQDQDGAFSALLRAEDATIETGASFSIPAEKDHIFHMVIRNETSSGMAKLMWRTGSEDYKESNSQYIPILANDDQYREYSYQIGLDKTFKDDITGFRIIPAYGNTDVGRISIYTMDLRKGVKQYSVFGQALELAEVAADGPVSAPVPKKEFPVLYWVLILAAVFGLTTFTVFLVARKKPDGPPDHA